MFWIDPSDSSISYLQMSFEINGMVEDPQVQILRGAPEVVGQTVTISWGETYTFSALLSGVEDFSEWNVYSAIMEYGLEYSSNQYGLVKKE